MVAHRFIVSLLVAPAIVVSFGCTAETPSSGGGSPEDGPPADLTLEEAQEMGFGYGKGDHFWDLCNWFGVYGNGTCESFAGLCPHTDSDCVEGDACRDSSSCGEGGNCWCNECVVGDAFISVLCVEPPPGPCEDLDQVGCYRRPDCDWPDGASACEVADPCGGDCDAATEFCRPTNTGDYVCHPYADEGETCGGFTPAWNEERCLPGSDCVVPGIGVTDVPGTCRAPSACGGAMDAVGQPSSIDPSLLCGTLFGYKWNGSSCEIVVGCECEGDDCGSLYPTAAACEDGQGCGDGMSCTYCWTGPACVPVGAVC